MKLFISALLSLGLCNTVYAMDNQSTQSSMGNQLQMQSNDANKNKMQGTDFLAKNKTKEGVVTLPTGLQYKVITAGTGPKPMESDVVTVDYTGKLINGTEFDSSSKHGGPATFPVGGVIPGWVEALKLMNVGSTWEVYIPPSLAYGEQGVPPVIGPNQVLVFNIHLINSKKQ